MALAHRRLHFRVAPRAVIHLFCGGQGFRATVDALNGERLRLTKPSDWRPNPGELCEVRFAAAGIIYSFSVVAEIVWCSDQAVSMRLRYLDAQRDWQIARYRDGFENAIAVNAASYAAG